MNPITIGSAIIGSGCDRHRYYPPAPQSFLEVIEILIFHLAPVLPESSTTIVWCIILGNALFQILFGCFSDVQDSVAAVILEYIHAVTISDWPENTIVISASWPDKRPSEIIEIVDFEIDIFILWHFSAPESMNKTTSHVPESGILPLASTINFSPK